MLIACLRPGFFLVAVLAQFLLALMLVHLLTALLACPRHEELLMFSGCLWNYFI